MEENGIFVNQRGIGFIFEIGLYLGSDKAIENELSALFKDILPDNSNIQFLFYSSDKVEHILDYWASNKVATNEVEQELVEKRVEFFKNLSNQGNNTFRIRDFGAIVSVSIETDTINHRAIAKIIELKTKTIAVFETRGQRAKEWGAVDLINFLSDIFNVSSSLKKADKEWSQYQSISSQIIDRCNVYSLSDDKLTLNEGEKEFRFLSIARYPQLWSLSQMSQVIGDSLNDYLKIPCPFLISYGVHIVGSKFKKTKMMAKASRVEWQANTPLGRWISAIR
ncbi:hypothetical protein MIDIC_10034 [Alphaproteobacteria bacterium]